MKAKTQRPTSRSRARGIQLSALSLCFAPVVFAADAVWNVDAAGSWATAGSWNPAAAPGSTSTTNSTDIATFGKTLTAGRTVTVDTNRNIGGITFDHSDAFAYTFSTTGNIRLSNGGVIQSVSTNGNHQDAVVTRIDIQGDGGSATFTSSGSSSSSLLTIGNSGTSGTIASVQGVSTAGNTTTLYLNGSNVGTGLTNATTNSIVGRIQNGSGGGNLAIVKSGAGTWRIGGDNTYTGGTTINDGTLSIGRNTALGTGSVTVNGPGILDIGGGGTVSGAISGRTVSGDGTITISNLGTTAGGYALTGSSAGSDYSGFTGTWNIGTSATAAGTAGRAIMNGATAAASDVNVFANATVSAETTVTHNASIVLNGGDTGESNGQLRLDSGAIWTGNVTLAGSITGTGDNTIGSTTGTGTISGIISESGGSRSLSKGGAGTIVLTKANTYSGGTFVNNGALNIQNVNALGTSTAVTVASGARLELQGGLTFTGKTISVAGNGGNYGALQSKSGTNVWSGNVTIAADAARIGAAAGATLEVSGVIDSGANVYNVTYRPENSTATVIVSGNNTYIGSTSIVGGVVSVSSLNKVVGGTASSNFGAPTTVANGTIHIGLSAYAATTNDAATLRYTGSGETTDRVINLAGTTAGATLDHSGSGLLKFTSDLTATGAGIKTLTLRGSTAGSGELSGAVVDNSGTNTTSLAKAGTGTWTLSGNNTYTGTTTVDGGTLVINGNQSTALGNVSVNNAGTRLKGTGTVGGDTTFNAGAIHSVGNSVGKQTFDDGTSTTLTYAQGSIFEWELGATLKDSDTVRAFRGTDWDAVNVSGTLGTTGSGAIFRVVLDGTTTFADAFWAENRQWLDIFKTSDAGSAVNFQSIFTSFQHYNYSGAGGSLADLGSPGTYGSFSIDGSTLKWTAVPEPTSALVGLLITAGLLRRRRHA